MTDITPNHLHIYRDRRGKHITLDGQDLLLDGEDPMLITGMENPAEVTRVMLTLLAPKITVDSEIEDREPEPATVDAPTSTLAEELLYRADLLDNGDPYGDTTHAIRTLAIRAEQMETEWEEELDQISADRDHWVQAYGEAAQDRDYLAAEIDKVNTDLPDPTDVPAPRTIHTREELYELPRRTVIRDKDGVVCERTSLGGGWYSPESTTDKTPFIALPATVLWTPEVAS